MTFHQLSGYFNIDSYIYYQSDVIQFTYKTGIVEVLESDGFDAAKIGCISYIPSERNVVNLSGISSLPLPENNLRSFIFDWFKAHSYFTKSNPIEIDILPIKYYYSEDEREDLLELSNGKTLPLREASSGMQSVVPLYVYIRYLTGCVLGKNVDASYDNNTKVNSTIRSLYAKHLFKGVDVLDADIDLLLNEESFVDKLDAFRKRLNNLRTTIESDNYKDDDSKVLFKLFFDIEDKLSKPNFLKIVIEEPELNLFPEAQVRLLYYILQSIDVKRDFLVLTTHSPYLLYALNNCMLGWHVKDEISEDDSFDHINSNWVNPEDVSVWELRDGFLNTNTDFKRSDKTIQDQNGLIRNNYFDRIMHNVMADFTNLMNYYESVE